MPKRKRSKSGDIEYYKNKIKKLERKIYNRQNEDCNERNIELESAPCTEEEIMITDDDRSVDTPALRPDDWLLPWPESDHADYNNQDKREPQPADPQPGPSTSPQEAPSEQTKEDINDLDTEVLEILGIDPACNEKFGPEIRNELASRFLHIAQEGLSKELRKELISKYLLPANCVQLNAPKMNPEIRAASGEPAIRRDKGIEVKQKQLSSAIACLSNIINSELNSRSRNNELLQKLMDIGRLLCDLQHADSVTRRNFILFAMKNDMKEHIKNTKIDTHLFGENLADTLKSAKAVNKSGVELKAELNNSSTAKYQGSGPRPLNRRPPPQARRPPAGPAPPAPRSREPATARAPYHPLPPHRPPHARSSRMSSQVHPVTYPRRR